MEAHFNEVGFWAVWYCQYNGMKNHSSELIVTPVISLEGYQASKSSFSSLSCPTSLLAQDQTKHRSKCSHAHACAFFLPLPSQQGSSGDFTHRLFAGREKQGCLWEEKEQNVPQCSQGSSGLLSLCLCVGRQVNCFSLFSRGSFVWLHPAV